MKQEMKKGAEREQELLSLLKTREAPVHISSGKAKGLSNDGPTLMKNGENLNANKEISCKMSTTNGDNADTNVYSGLSKADIRALVLQELQIVGAGIEASPYRKRDRPISSKVNVPR